MRNCPICGGVADRVNDTWACYSCNWIEYDPNVVEPSGIELPQDVSDWLSSEAVCLDCGHVDIYLKAAALMTMNGCWCQCGGVLTANNDFHKTIEPLWRDLGGSN
jgi:hypothetical protein